MPDLNIHFEAAQTASEVKDESMIGYIEDEGEFLGAGDTMNGGCIMGSEGMEKWWWQGNIWFIRRLGRGNSLYLKKGIVANPHEEDYYSDRS